MKSASISTVARAAGRRWFSGLFFRSWRAAGALLCCLWLTACESGTEPETISETTLIRFVNATPDATGPLRFSMEGGVSAQVMRNESSSYTRVEPRIYAVTIEDDVDQWKISGDLEIISGIHQTLVAFGGVGGPGGVLLGDDTPLPRNGQSLVRILHVGPDLFGSIDVYVAAPGADLTAATAVASGFIFPSALDYTEVVPGTWRVVLLDSDTGDLLCDSTPLAFTNGETYTLVIVNKTDGTPEVFRLRDGA